MKYKQSLFFANAQNKGLVGIFILVLILAVAVAGGAYYLSRVTSKPQVTETNQATPATPSPSKASATEGDPTANWKVYTSNFGFSFKYPENEEVINIPVRDKFGNPFSNDLIGRYAIHSLGMNVKGAQGGLSEGIIIVPLSLEEVVESEKSSLSFLTIVSENKITFNGYPGVELIRENPQIKDPEVRTRARQKTLLIYKDEKTFIVDLDDDKLSTFKFTSQ